ncbi:hypothetical protein [Photorhabdus khanii]|uniref:DUF2157 domain-containing protein n=1 Tax=Photorhabdus khanii subsp. guanajuatensis TaxID=2100166 RepID=A0A4V2X964_9GAMM|nr:hypothetical protein [Photorhabdus khanii]TDB62565.1 hypothetical protein C5467_02240 [Photorhabdus khanii subsp. guanajuatensis]
MTELEIEELMLKSGFTSCEVNLIRSVAKKNGTTTMDEINFLGNRFYRFVVVVLFFIFIVLFVFFTGSIMNFYGVLFAMVVSTPIAFSLVPVRLVYKSFIFMKSYKRLIS